MIVYLNGRFVPEEQAVVSIQDRGFLYGDGLFETIRIYSDEPFLWREHIDRFARGAEALGIIPPLSANETLLIVRELLRRNDLDEALLRLTLSRGQGPRGYSPRGAEHPTFAVTLFPAPTNLPRAFKVIISSHRLFSGDRLAQFKHASKLVQIAARMEADAAHADEALLLNERKQVVEGTSTNLFWIEKGRVCTAPIAHGILPGITRQYLFRLLNGEIREKAIYPDELPKTEGIFLTSSAIELVEVSTLNGKPVRRSPLAAEIKALYRSRRTDSNEACPPGNSTILEQKDASTTSGSGAFRRKRSLG
jgi:branched-chain amino acid aminotransferase